MACSRSQAPDFGVSSVERLGTHLPGGSPASRYGRRPEAGAWERGQSIIFLCRTHVLKFGKRNLWRWKE